MKRWKDEEDPAAPRCYMSIQRITSPPRCIFLTFNDLKRKVESFWDIILVISCVIAVSLDSLFFYIPTINGEEKCLEMDVRLRTVSLVLRSFTDIVFILDILEQISKATTKAEVWWSLATDFLCLLPTPQVLIVVIFYKNRDLYLKNSKIMNVLLLIQYVPRIYRLKQSFDNLKRKNETGLWVKIAFNFFRYILACHILGASWFFFSIQREILCWYQVCSKHNTCGTYFKCNENSSRDITKLVELCPMNPPNSTVFDFGMFVNPLGTSSRTPINFSTKFSYSFWWGVRNLSNFGTNLETSTYLWENWFASLISIIGLLLFVYLIGNNVQTYMQMKTKKAEDEAKAERIRLEAEAEAERIRLEAERIRLEAEAEAERIRLEAEAERIRLEAEAERIRLEAEAERRRLQQTQINLWLEQHELSWLEEYIEEKIEEKYKEDKDVNPANVLTLLSLIPTDYYYCHTKVKILLKMLENMPVLQEMPFSVLSSISKTMEIVEYPENTWIVNIGEPLDRMLIITEGTLGIDNASADPSSPSAVIQGSLDECSIYGLEQLLSWVPNPPDLDRLPISKESVKCLTKVEGFVLTASHLKTVLSLLCDTDIIRDIYSDEEHHAEDST